MSDGDPAIDAHRKRLQVAMYSTIALAVIVNEAMKHERAPSWTFWVILGVAMVGMLIFATISRRMSVRKR